MPQESGTHLPFPIEPESELAEQRRDCLLHTVGNLTLLTGKLNSAISNSPWEDKHPEITTHSLLRLNKDLGTYPVWDESWIRIRGEKLFETAKPVWPHGGLTGG